MPDIEIRRLFWDDWNREHAAKHGISIFEINMLLAGWVFGQETYEHRTWYVFSARPASRRERRRHGSQAEGDEQ